MTLLASFVSCVWYFQLRLIGFLERDQKKQNKKIKQNKYFSWVSEKEVTPEENKRTYIEAKVNQLFLTDFKVLIKKMIKIIQSSF